MVDRITTPAAITDDSWMDKPLDEPTLAKIKDPTFLDYVEDIWSSAGRGLKENIASYPGTLGDLLELTRSAGVLNEKYLGENDSARVEQIRKEPNPLPTTEDVYDAMTINPYKPRTGAGEVTRQITSLISPRGITRGLEHLGRDVIVPYLAGKAGEKVGEQFGPEEAQLLSATSGLKSGPLYEGSKRVAVSRIQGPTGPEPATTMRTLQGLDAPLTPERPNAQQERMRRLRDQGIEVTGGQAMGSEGLRRWEAGPYSTKGGAQNEQQARQLTRAALASTGINAETLSPEVADAAYDSFGAMYDDLIQRNNGIVMDPVLLQAVTDIGVNAEGLMGGPTLATQFYDRITQAAQQNGGVIPPDVYRQIHSELSQTARSIRSDPSRTPEAQALRDLQGALYDTIGRNGQPEVQAQSRDLNNRYRNFKILTKAVGGAGQGVSYGLISPEKLRAELERRDPAAYQRGQGDLNQLARDAQSLAALPVTGTGAQLASSGLSGLATTMAINAPASALLTSKPVKTRLVSRALGDNPALFDPMQMPPIVSQAVEPVPVEMTPPPIPQSQLGSQQQGALQPLTDDPLDQRRQVAGLPLPDMLAGLAGLRMGRV